MTSCTLGVLVGRGCVVECRICNREVAGSNLGLGYFAPRSTQPSIPPGSVNEYHLRLGRQRQVWFIPIADERVGVQIKLWNPLRTLAIPERFCSGDSLRRGAMSSVWTFTFCTEQWTALYMALNLTVWKPSFVLVEKFTCLHIGRSADGCHRALTARHTGADSEFAAFQNRGPYWH